MMIPPLYFVSLLHSLVARVMIKRMLDDHLASEGIHRSAHGITVTKSTVVHGYPSVGVGPEDDSHDRGVQASEVGAEETDDIVPLKDILVCTIPLAVEMRRV